MKQKFDLSQLTIEDLLELNRQVKDRFTQLQQQKSYQALTKYKVGDRVTFTTLEGRKVSGTITRLNKKSVTMQEDGSLMDWRVSPTLLKKVSEVKFSGNVVKFPSF
jgi:hypothetical protein